MMFWLFESTLLDENWELTRICEPGFFPLGFFFVVGSNDYHHYHHLLLLSMGSFQTFKLSWRLFHEWCVAREQIGSFRWTEWDNSHMWAVISFLNLVFIAVRNAYYVVLYHFGSVQTFIKCLKCISITNGDVSALLDEPWEPTFFFL